MPAANPTHADVVSAYRDVEEADKIHFVRFVPYARAGQRHVTADNLDKTRRLMGQETRDSCARKNVSTGWTGIPLHTPAPEAQPEWHCYR